MSMAIGHFALGVGLTGELDPVDNAWISFWFIVFMIVNVNNILVDREEI